MSNEYDEFLRTKLLVLSILIVLSILFGSQAYAQTRPEQAAVEAYAKDTVKWGLDFNCGEAIQIGAFISGGQIPNDEELAYAVSEGFCAGYIMGVVQMLSNIESEHIDPAVIDQICAEDAPEGYYREVGDRLPDVAGSRFTARVATVLTEIYPCN